MRLDQVPTWQCRETDIPQVLRDHYGGERARKIRCQQEAGHAGPHDFTYWKPGASSKDAETVHVWYTDEPTDQEVEEEPEREPLRAVTKGRRQTAAASVIRQEA